MTNKIVVTTDDSQALTNKDLTGSGNTFPTLNQSTTGNAATATKLAAARTINGVPFDGTTAVEVGESFAPSDYGWIGWSYDILKAYVANTALTAGQTYYTMLPVRYATTITNVIMYVGTAGATLTSGQCLAGLFDKSGTLLSLTGDQSTSWASTGLKTMALTTPQAVSAGLYYVGYLFNGTTSPKFQFDGAAAGQLGTGSLSATVNPRSATDSTHTGRTTSFPAPPTFSNLSTPFWVGVS